MEQHRNGEGDPAWDGRHRQPHHHHQLHQHGQEQQADQSLQQLDSAALELLAIPGCLLAVAQASPQLAPQPQAGGGCAQQQELQQEGHLEAQAHLARLFGEAGMAEAPLQQLAPAARQLLPAEAMELGVGVRHGEQRQWLGATA